MIDAITTTLQDELPLPANLTVLGLLILAAWLMFRRTLSRLDTLELENSTIREDAVRRCAEEIHHAVEEALRNERQRSSAIEASLRSDLVRLRRGLQKVAESATDPATLQIVLRLLSGYEDSRSVNDSGEHRVI